MQLSTVFFTTQSATFLEFVYVAGAPARAIVRRRKILHLYVYSPFYFRYRLSKHRGHGLKAFLKDQEALASVRAAYAVKVEQPQ